MSTNHDLYECPACGETPMVIRHAGSLRFYGCTVPKCRGMRDDTGHARSTSKVALRDVVDELPSDRARKNDQARWRHEG